MSQNSVSNVGDFIVNGSSDFMYNYENQELFQPGDDLVIGLSGDNIQFFSGQKDDNQTYNIAGFCVPAQNATSQSQLVPNDITDAVLNSVALFGYDVVQSPQIFASDPAKINLIAYGTGSDGKTHVLFRENPLDIDGEQLSNDVFQYDQSDLAKSTRGFFANFPGAVQDRLENSDSGSIEIQFQEE